MKKWVFFSAAAAFFIFMAAGYFYSLQRLELQQMQLSPPTENVLRQKQEIDADTKMIYQYFYTKDRVMQEKIEPSPDFLQGLDRAQLESVYNGWQLVYFSPEKVILRCRIEGKSSESYLIGEYEGFVAVFYEDIQKTIHLQECTDIPLSALPEGEQVQLRDGLRVTGEENLARVLADYLS